MSLYRFYSQAGAEVLMYSHHVEPVMKEAELIFHDQGAFLAQDLEQVIARLDTVLNSLSQTEVKPQELGDETEEQLKKIKNFVSYKTRFYPLMRLLQKGLTKQKHVHWEKLS